MNVSNIPLELKHRTQWVCWRYEEKQDGTMTKVPYVPHSDMRASTIAPAHWTNFAKALAAYSTGGYDGVGFVFTHEDPYFGVDLDDCYGEDGVLTLPELRWVNQLDSYTEISPSGKGVKIIGRGTLPPSDRHSWGGNGIYDHGRFFTITGNVLDAHHADLRTVDSATLDGLLAEWFPPVVKQGWDAVEERLTDAEVIGIAMRAANADKFGDLLIGNYEGWYGEDGHSEADAGLISLLAFYTGPCPQQLDRLFRNSGLMRDKWDERRGNETYGERTIRQVLSMMEEYYDMAPRFSSAPQTDAPPPRTLRESLDEVTPHPSLITAPPKASTRQENKKRWAKLQEKHPSLTMEERPLGLRLVYEHVAPLAERLGDDWIDMMSLSFLSAVFANVRIENRPVAIDVIGISTQGTGKSATGDELERVVRAVVELDATAVSTFTGGSAAGLVRLLNGPRKKVLAYLSEWSAFAKLLDAEHSSSLREMILNVWDGRGYTHTLATEVFHIKEPFMVLNGLTTPAMWKKVASYEDTGNGFYSRFLFVAPDVKPATMEEYPYVTDMQRSHLVTALFNMLSRIPPIEGARLEMKPSPAYTGYSKYLGLGRTSEAIDLDEVGFSAEDTRANLPSGRLLEYVKRVATVLELLEEVPQVRGGILLVREANVEKAIRLVQRSAGYAQRCYGWLARSRDDEQATVVRQLLEREPGTIYNLVTRTHYSAVDVQRAIDLLSSDGLIGNRIVDGKRIYEANGRH